MDSVASFEEWRQGGHLLLSKSSPIVGSVVGEII